MKLVIYWSGTGNTEMMANEVAKGATDSKCIEVSAASVDDVKEAEALAFGCPSMGDEVLEESEMEPFIESIEGLIAGKPVVLFGSYDWGDGEWMRDWEDRMKKAGADLRGEGLIAHLTPEDDDLEKCVKLGELLN